MRVITLTTDLGVSDWFVGSMKGLMLGIDPAVDIVDITHEVPPGDVRAGAFALAASYRCFPRNTVHMAAVDPVAGSRCAGIMVKTPEYQFVGPDNGVLSMALEQEKVLEIRRLDNDIYFHKPISNTCRARDIFGPVAIFLTQAILVDSLGEKLPDYFRPDWARATVDGDTVRGEIVYFDRFGNAITNIRDAAPTCSTVRVGTRVECELKAGYQDVAAGQPLGVIGSSGFIEVSIAGGNARTTYSLKLGDAVEVK